MNSQCYRGKIHSPAGHSPLCHQCQSALLCVTHRQDIWLCPLEHTQTYFLFITAQPRYKYYLPCYYSRMKVQQKIAFSQNKWSSKQFCKYPSTQTNGMIVLENSFLHQIEASASDCNVLSSRWWRKLCQFSGVSPTCSESPSSQCWVRLHCTQTHSLSNNGSVAFNAIYKIKKTCNISQW